ncbi:MAG: hypothetical protein CR997_06670 [Acidobacteria bacterium]|nr:MAG: hypothetical protein CR997_06670 [Acidobacteriota bacterium]
MQKILIVEDDTNQRLFLKDVILSALDKVQLFEADNGKHAVQVLCENNIALTITDLHMPEMNGSELITWMRKNQPDIPIIVSTAVPSLATKEKILSQGVLQYIQKPIDRSTLVHKIKHVLTEKSGGYLKGITIPAFLQLLIIEHKSCTLEINSQGKTGSLYIKDGLIINATLDQLSGEKAALEIISWIDGDIRIKNLNEDMTPVIDKSASYLIMEAMRMKDMLENKKKTSTESGNLFQSKLQKLLIDTDQTIGFKCFIIVKEDGEIIAHHCLDDSLDIENLTKSIQRMCKTSAESMKAIGSKPPEECLIKSADYVIALMHKKEYCMFFICDKHGKTAIMRMHMVKLAEQIKDLFKEEAESTNQETPD